MHNNWIHNKYFDGLFVIGPAFLCLGIILLFPGYFNKDINNEWAWAFLIILIDVGHVYTTLYRTYLNKEIVSNHKTLLLATPILLYLAGVAIHSLSPLLFWRVLAYFAVFHFMRQQYGFLKIYTRQEADSNVKKLGSIMIYSATLVPVACWHLIGPQEFNWFTDNDFFFINQPEFTPFLLYPYYFLIIIYITQEAVTYYKHRYFNLPKNLLIAGTILSWYFGILVFKGDLSFTLLNVVSHGIPYYALVWSYGNKLKNNPLKYFFKPGRLFLFIGFAFILSYTEELLWDGLIWKEHLKVFPTTRYLLNLAPGKELLSFIIPLLSLPQITHYWLDGFIWKLKKDQFNWSQILRS